MRGGLLLLVIVVPRVVLGLASRPQQARQRVAASNAQAAAQPEQVDFSSVAWREIAARSRGVLVERCPANGVLELTLARGGDAGNRLTEGMLSRLEDALLDHEHCGVLLRSVGEARAFCTGSDYILDDAMMQENAAHPDDDDDASREDDPRLDRRSRLAREARVLASLRDRRGTPPLASLGPAATTEVIAVADGAALGFGAGLWLAASLRVCTEATVVALPECRAMALCPAGCALGALERTVPTHLAHWIALTGYPLTSRDCLDLGLATHFVSRRDERLDTLLDELRRAPEHALGVPLASRSADLSDPPAHLASALTTPAVDAALRRVFFGDDDDDNVVPETVAAVVARVEAERAKAAASVGSCAWRTREMAEPVLEVLDHGLEAFKAASPVALETTYRVQRALRRRAASDTETTTTTTPPSVMAVDQLAARLATEVNAKLVASPDFVEAVARDAAARAPRRGSAAAAAASVAAAPRSHKNRTPQPWVLPTLDDDAVPAFAASLVADACEAVGVV